jgi:very-short-patch-repair endonuclease
VRGLRQALRVADTQFGVASRRQLLGADVAAHHIKGLVRAGILQPEHPGVYVVAGSTKTIEQRALAACLACGDRAAASFTTAGALMRLVPEPDTIDVTVPDDCRPRSTTIRTHRSKAFGPLDVSHRGPLVLTSPARTLADFASCMRETDLTLATDEVLRRRLISASALLRFLERPSIKVFRGVGVLREIVKDRVANGLPDTGFEALMIELLREFGLPEPIRQYRTVATGRRVRFDLAYPDHRFIVELDGWDPHSAHESWQSDHDRQNDVDLDGWGRLGFTWFHIHHRRGYVAVTVGERLGLRPKGWVSSKTARRRRASGRNRARAQGRVMPKPANGQRPDRPT